jgi:hypothetical protein
VNIKGFTIIEMNLSVVPMCFLCNGLSYVLLTKLPPSPSLDKGDSVNIIYLTSPFNSL